MCLLVTFLQLVFILSSRHLLLTSWSLSIHIMRFLSCILQRLLNSTGAGHWALFHLTSMQLVSGTSTRICAHDNIYTRCLHKTTCKCVFIYTARTAEHIFLAGDLVFTYTCFQISLYIYWSNHSAWLLYISN